MNSEKIIRELTRRGLEFRGELTLDECLKLPGFSKGEIGYEFKYCGCKAMMFFALRKAPENGKVGDAKTECKDILIRVDETDDDAISHSVLEYHWSIPEMVSKENQDGVYSLELDEDCHITSCSHICGCCVSGGWHFDEWWTIPYYDVIENAFDCIAGCKKSFGFLPETCTPVKVGRPGYRD